MRAITPPVPVLRKLFTSASLLVLAACGGTTANGAPEPPSPAGDAAGGTDATAPEDGGVRGGTTCGAAGTASACLPRTIGHVTTNFGGVSSIADDATNVYVADEGGQIQAVAVADGTSTILATLGTTNDGTSLAVGSADVFFSSGGMVGSVAKSGGAVKTLVTGENDGFGIAVTGTSVFWEESYTTGVTGGNSGQIFALPLGGGTPTSLASKLEVLDGLAIDAVNVYWVNGSSIESVPLVGGAVTTLAANQDGAGALATDGVNVYWSEDNAQIGGCGLCPPPPAPTSTDSSVYKIPVTGGAKTLVTHGYRIDTIATDGTNLYWFDSDQKTLSTVAVSGGTPFVLATGVGSAGSLLADTSYLYWISTDNELTRLAKQANER